MNPIDLMRTKKRRKQRKRSIQFLSNNDIHSHNISFYEEMSRYLSVFEFLARPNTIKRGRNGQPQASKFNC